MVYVIETVESLRALPKIQLHCHLEGTLRAPTFVNLARRHGVALRYDPARPEAVFDEALVQADPAAHYAFEDFRAFLLTFAAVSRSLAEPEDYALLAREYVEDALAQSVAYAEVFISPSVWRFFRPELDLEACMASIHHVFEEARKAGLTVSVIVDLTRNFGVESAMQTARLAVAWQRFGVIGIGLGGDEARFPAALFAEPFAYARASGLRAVAHAGEAAGARSVLEAVEVLGAERIGHGVRALEDSDVVRMLAQRRIPLEICPTSNFLTGAADRTRPHPLLALDAAGVIVTIDADDPALFGTSITQEYAYVAQLAGRDALHRFVANAIEASFANEPQKAALRARLKVASTHVGP